jgi:hypothetical protein
MVNVAIRYNLFTNQIWYRDPELAGFVALHHDLLGFRMKAQRRGH